MNINNYSQNNLTNNDDESNFTEVINRFSNLPQTNVIQAGPSSQNVNDMYTPITYSNNMNNVAIFDQQSMSNTYYYDSVPDDHYHQPLSNVASVASYNNVSVSNDASSYNPYHHPMSNDASYNNYVMSNDVSYNPPMPNDASYNNNSTISQYNDQNPVPSNNFPSFNIIINSPQNISEIFRHGFKIIIMPVTNSDVQDQLRQDYTYLDRSLGNSQ
ncbi:hypothetical protein C1645_437292 [Glomus cerebriforme]|uniref:Uncharacterized protein n=1 Tax=Glomus cerebriforme TaxID=658196 RepID=A0A397SH36_9GLOM|nr:hypothetical protein C1645_437292 [Glomus cerebriforme]